MKSTLKTAAVAAVAFASANTAAMAEVDLTTEQGLIDGLCIDIERPTVNDPATLTFTFSDEIAAELKALSGNEREAKIAELKEAYEGLIIQIQKSDALGNFKKANAGRNLDSATLDMLVNHALGVFEDQNTNGVLNISMPTETTSDADGKEFYRYNLVGFEEQPTPAAAPAPSAE